MLREILTSRVLQIGFVLCAVIISSLQLYSWHVRRTTETELEKTIQTLRRVKESYKTRSSEGVNVSGTNNITRTNVNIRNNGMDPMTSQEMKALQNDKVATGTDSDILYSVGSLDGETNQDIPVSPYGFGPYPEIPKDMPLDTFPSPTPEHELLARVQIRLLKEGINVQGMNMENGWAYPVIPGIVYVEWDEYERPDGIVRYISNMLAHSSDGFRFSAIREQKGKSFTKADIPSNIKVLSFQEGAIDPYTYLDLQPQ